MVQVVRREGRQRRHLRLRNRISGTQQRPRLSVYRSLQHIYAQIVDDVSGETLVAASTLDPALRNRDEGTGNASAAHEVGKLLAARAQERGIERVVFDRGGNLYHGRVAALADGAREGGLEF